MAELAIICKQAISHDMICPICKMYPNAELKPCETLAMMKQLHRLQEELKHSRDLIANLVLEISDLKAQQRGHILGRIEI